MRSGPVVAHHAQGNIAIGDDAKWLSIGATNRQKSKVVECHQFCGTSDGFVGLDPLNIMSHDFFAMHGWAPS
jgi:hypothetical protein